MHRGQLIDERYLLEAEAGAGGMGQVFCARDQRTGQLVALKCLHAEAGDAERFAREATVLAGIEHPAVVRYLGHGATAEGEPWLAMEWLEGLDLAQRLAQGRLTVEETLAVAEGAAEALGALHAAGIVHRDVKPSNLFLVGGSTARVKLLDLGVARPVRVSWTLTVVGSAIGTPAYMAPEQARGEAVDARADVFALGCVLFECLTGVTPFHAEHPVAALARMLVEEAPRAGEAGVEVPRGVEALLARLLAKQPAARPPDGAAVVAALRSLDALTPPSLPSAPAQRLTGDEQRVVCVVLTRPSAGTDATQLPEERTALETRVRAAVEPHGGRIEALVSGSFVAIVSGAGAPTDQAARGAACALAVAAALGNDAVALCTGRGVVSGRVPLGAVIDRAALLLGGGHAGVRVDDATAALLAGRYDFTREGSLQLLGAPRDALEAERRLLGRPSACVGRERELGALTAALATAGEEPVATAVLVTAPAGTGKSRLVAEFVKAARGRDDVADVLVGRCDPMSAGSPLAVIASLVRRAAGGGEARGGREALALLAGRLERGVPAAEAARTAELLAELAGLNDTPAAGAPTAGASGAAVSEQLLALRQDRVLLGDALAAAWTDWLAVECRRGTLVVVLEDLHWSDAGSVRFLDMALRNLGDQPLLVVGTARPEVHESFPRLLAERGLQELRLGSVSRKAAERLARAALGPEVASTVIDALVERSGGHPFLLEELIRTVAVGGQLGTELPDTVLGMLQARFDSLSEVTRATLRAASVFGERFWEGGVRRLLGSDASTGTLASALAELTERELVQGRAGSSLAGQRELAFRHALVRDAAYAMLTDRDRALGHRLAAEWLVEHGLEDALALAEHFDRGGEPARATPWYRRAATQALEGNDLTLASALAARALERTRDPAEASSLEVLLAEAAYWSGQLSASVTHAEAAARRHAVGTEGWFQATALAITSLGQLGRNDEVRRWLDATLDSIVAPASDAAVICASRGISQLAYVDEPVAQAEYARLVGLLGARAPGALAAAWMSRAEAEVGRVGHDVHAATAAVVVAAEAFDRAGARRYACLMRIFSGVFSGLGADAGWGLGVLDQALAEAQRLGAEYLVGFCIMERGLIRALTGDLDGAIADIDRAQILLQGSRRLELGVALTRMLVAYQRAEYADAERIARRLYADAEGHIRSPLLGHWLAAIMAAAGRFDEAQAELDALAVPGPPVHDLFDRYLLPGVGPIARARIDRGRGDVAAARRAVLEGLEAVVAGRPPEHRQAPWFVRRQPYADLRALAAELGLEGDGGPGGDPTSFR